METKHLKGRVFNRDKGTIEQYKKTRTIPFIASTELKDRHGSIIKQDTWDLSGFRDNPVIGYQHQVHPDMCIKATPDDVIGKAQNVRVDGGNLLMDVWFETEDINPTADKVFKKLLAGTLNAVSVGFLPILDEKGNDTYQGRSEDGEDPTADYFHGVELLEVSVVNIPSNKQALQKAYRDTTANAMLFLKSLTGKSFGEIEDMQVKDVLSMVEKGTDAKEDKVSEEEIPDKTEEVQEETPDGGEDETPDAANAVVDAKSIELELKRKKLKIC